jgi:phospholipid-transporting ATPase
MGLAIFNWFPIGTHGYNAGQWFVGSTIYTAVLITVVLKSGLISDYWPIWTHFAIWGSLIIWFTFLPIYSALYGMINFARELSGVAAQMYGSGVFWFAIIVCPVVCLARDYVWKVLKRNFWPRPYHIVQEIEKHNLPDTLEHAERFTKELRKVRIIQRMRRSRGYAFSQTESGQADLVRRYDTTRVKPSGY